MPPAISVKDISLFLLKELSSGEVLNKAVEFGGEIIETMSVDSRPQRQRHWPAQCLASNFSICEPGGDLVGLGADRSQTDHRPAFNFPVS
jgi:hypothetical protein